MYSSTDDCNNSPTFNSQPIPYVCAGQITNYDFGILELDGDSLTFEFDTSRTLGNAPMLYEPGFTYDEPIPGIVMDPATGLLSFTQGVEGNYVITLLITEYDACGNKVGDMIHDIQVVVETCTNQVPTLIETPSIIQNFNNFGTNASLEGDREIKLCTGDRFCFDVQFDDPNLTDNVVLSSNVANFLPGATFSQTAGNPATATICWEFAQGYTGSIISINATDDVCNVPGFADVAIKLDVPPALFPGKDTTALVCGTEGTINLFDYFAGAYYQPNGQWYDPNDNPISNVIADASTMIDGVYYYRVLPDTTGVACGNPPPLCALADTGHVEVITSQLSALWSQSNVSNETCLGTDDGQAQIGPITGNFAPFTVVWQSPYSGIHDTQTITNNNTAAQTNLFQDQLGGDPWSVTVTDTNGCSITEQFFIYAGGLEIDPIVGEVNCFGDATGSINAQITGGLQVGGQQFVVITNAANDTLNGADQLPPDYRQQIEFVPAGTYTISAFDTLGCEANIQVIIRSKFPSRPQIVYETVNPLCFGDETGTIVITDVINSHGDVDDIFFSWAPNPPPNPPSVPAQPGRVSLRGLPAGDYTVEVTDTLGCTAEPSPIVITITQPNDLQGEYTIAQEPLCRTNGAQTGKGLVSGGAISGLEGAGNVKQLWTHLGTGQTANVPTFNVRAPGLIELELRDGNDCIWKDTFLLDSINPVADFEITSDGFYLEDIYEGDEDLRIRIENLTDVLTMKTKDDPNADIIFQWNLNTSMINDQNYWFFTNSVDERIDTIYSGVLNDKPTEYQVCLTIRNANDCADTTCKLVQVHRIPELILPNVFTPGTIPNDKFFFPVVGYQEFTADVFNRYGIKVAEFIELDDQWDGNHFKSGKPCSDGVYYYTYKAVTTNGTIKEGAGNLHLMRHKP